MTLVVAHSKGFFYPLPACVHGEHSAHATVEDSGHKAIACTACGHLCVGLRLVAPNHLQPAAKDRKPAVVDAHKRAVRDVPNEDCGLLPEHPIDLVPGKPLVDLDGHAPTLP